MKMLSEKNAKCTVTAVVALLSVLCAGCGSGAGSSYSSSKSSVSGSREDLTKSEISISQEDISDNSSESNQADISEVCKVWQVTMIMNTAGDTHTLSDYANQTGTDVSNWNIELTINTDGTSLVSLVSQGSTQQGSWTFDGNILVVSNSDGTSEWLHYDNANKILEQDVSGNGSLMLIYTEK